MKIRKLFQFQAHLIGNILMKFDDSSLEKEYLSKSSHTRSVNHSMYIMVSTLVCLLSFFQRMCFSKAPILDRSNYELLANLLICLFLTYQNRSHDANAMLVYISTLMHSNSIVGKFKSFDYRFLGLKIGNAADWQAFVLIVQFLADILFSKYVFLGMKQTIRMFTIGSIYCVFHNLNSRAEFFEISFPIYIIMKILVLCHVHSDEKNERRHFCLSRKLIIYKNSWESLFREVKNPIVIINSADIKFCNCEFEKIFSADYSHHPEKIFDCFAKMYNGVQNLKSVISNTFTKNELHSDIASLKNLGVFKCEHQNTTLQFEVSYKNVCWKTTNCIYVDFKNVTGTLKNQKEVLSKQYRNILLTTASHEMRNPLNGILGGLELLNNSCEKLSEKLKQQYIKTIIANSELLMNVINCLNDYCMYQTKALTLNISTFPIKELIHYCIDLFLPQAIEKGVSINVIFQKGIIEIVKNDYNRIKQILINLLSNSVKYTFSGYINVCIASNDIYTEIVIKDTGIGIKESTKSTLFKLFGRLDQVEQGFDAGAGAGLGLTIGQAMAKEIGHGITFESEPKKGSKFQFTIYNNLEFKGKSSKNIITNTAEMLNLPFIKREIKRKPSLVLADTNKENNVISIIEEPRYLPVNSMLQKGASLTFEKIEEETEDIDVETNDISPELMEHEEKAISRTVSRSLVFSASPFSSYKKVIKFQRSSPNNLSCTSKTALIVDDNSFNLVVIEGLLRRLNIKCIKAFNGKEALSVLDAKKDSGIQVILMDCEMPVMNGFEACVEMKLRMRDDQYPYIPIIAVTAYTDDNTRKKCIKAGMDGYISKPVIFDRLKEKLQHYDIIL